MTELVVIDAGQDALAEKIISGIGVYAGSTEDVRIVRAATCEEIRGSQPDILVLAEDTVKTMSEASERIRCGILLLPGDGGTQPSGARSSDAPILDAEAFDARCIVTYGMSPKNTITLSSIGETSCVLAIQREFITSDGDMLERQEIRITGGMRPGCLLAVAGALLILGLKLSAP